MTLIRFDSDFPEENRSAVLKLCKRHQKIIPDWCRVLTIYFSKGGKDGTLYASTYVDYVYRYAQLYIYAGWLTSREQEHEIVHELFHIVTAPNADYARDELKRLLAEATKEHRESVLESHKNAVESMVEDLTTLYMARRLNRPG